MIIRKGGKGPDKPVANPPATGRRPLPRGSRPRRPFLCPHWTFR